MDNAKDVAKRIKRITEWDVIEDYHKLSGLNPTNIPRLSRCGLKVVDYFTFHERLHTKGKKGISFIEFLNQFNRYKEKPYIHNQLEYYREIRPYETPEWKKYNIFKMYFGSINAFKPTVAMQVYHRYRPHTVLDFTAGWGGRMVGACAYGVSRYVGIDTNVNLLVPYGEMIDVLQNLTSTKMELHIWDAATFDYSRISYDMVFTSPPYYGIEQYSHQTPYRTKQEMSKYFYQPAIQASWKHLSEGGVYAINCNKAVFKNEFVPILGEPDEMFEMDMDVKSREHEYGEAIYVWKKPRVTGSCICSAL